jgi:hypothetical protein
LTTSPSDIQAGGPHDATPARNLASILRLVPLCSHGQGKLPVVWVCSPARTVRLVLPLNGDHAGVIQLRTERETADYLVRRIGSDFGDGFEVTKVLSEERYQVNLSNEGHTCDCRGHLAHGHCKHVFGLVALRDRHLI